MKFKLDENLPLDAAAPLRQAGFDVETVWGESLSGADDGAVAERVKHENRILITLDLDFADIRAYPPQEHGGIIVLRIKAQDKPTVVSYMRRLAMTLGRRSPVGELWIVERDRVRFRTAG